MSVPVTGKCPAGHVTNETAPGRRLTWHGTCSADGCDLPVHCKRIAKPAAGDPPPAGGNPSRYIRLDTFDDLPDHAPGTGLTVEPDVHRTSDSPPTESEGDQQHPADPVTGTGEPPSTAAGPGHGLRHPIVRGRGR